MDALAPLTLPPNPKSQIYIEKYAENNQSFKNHLNRYNIMRYNGDSRFLFAVICCDGKVYNEYA
ncbi:hypothetical protein AAGU57_06700 [Edwardsiella ictaluri]|uniref:hypothetical protein n=1 Tax=Edwardsiella ictaluri TaxID=67780 RepID=UPI001E630827|nr:hypothetical protein [Edwardsiella ictaluri]BEH98626.1 hypothetical protein KH20906_13540 [Edwardsiella ictaluri]BEI02121.1 hypothetical protein KB20921_13820 [Edwardsiella ictaluri]BEI05589.1 hypothetical protein KH201010_13750 [Edwardsiella ictaluri]BEI09047.1 hypothetical protein STU22726_13780 [Edwardsiella ictaluri]BEI12527.1 hypothetical protein STU22816_13800 [Edwardsiella ictaluri]